MLRLLRRALAFFQRRADPAQEQHSQQAELQQADIQLRSIQGIVTNLCGDYGFINEWIYFTSDIVADNMPLKVGQKVVALMEGGEIFQELKAVKVDHDNIWILYSPVTSFYQVQVLPDNIDDLEPSYLETRVMKAYVTAVSANTVYIDEEIYFSLDIVSEDFMPYKGDWVEVEYSCLPGPYNIKVHSAKPLFCKHLEEVCITSLYGRNGVIDNSIFFTLDSLKIPDGYSPQKYDIVDVVIVGSIQSCYIWRAMSMNPVPN